MIRLILNKKIGNTNKIVGDIIIDILILVAIIICINIIYRGIKHNIDEKDTIQNMKLENSKLVHIHNNIFYDSNTKIIYKKYELDYNEFLVEYKSTRGNNYSYIDGEIVEIY